jgi:hypothetical protein
MNETANVAQHKVESDDNLGVDMKDAIKKIGCHYYLTSGADATCNYHLLGVQCLTDKVTIRSAKTKGKWAWVGI